MPKTVKYIGTVTRWPELATTGKQSTWVPGQQEQRSDTEAAQLLATGLFSDVDATQLPEQKVVAISGVVSGAWTGGGYDPIGAQITPASGTITPQAGSSYTATAVATVEGPAVRYLSDTVDKYLEVWFALPRPMVIQQIVAWVQMAATASATLGVYAGTSSAFSPAISKGLNVGSGSGINSPQANGLMVPIMVGQDPTNTWSNAAPLNLNSTLFTHIKVRCTPQAGAIADFTLAKITVNPKGKSRICITLDDGYTEVFTRFLPLIEARGLKCSMGIIPSNIGNPSTLSLADMIRAEANGHEILTHGPFANSGAGSLVSNHATDEAAVADAVLSRQTLIDLGFLKTPAQRATYIWPQGVFQRSPGHSGILDGMLAAGFTNARTVIRYLSNSNALARSSKYGGLMAPIAGHIRSSISAVDEDTIITNTMSAMSYAANNGLDTSLMFHKIIDDQGVFAATANNDIEVSRFVTLMDHLVSLIAAGKAENVLFSKFAA